jgi:hypothetical protein
MLAVQLASKLARSLGPLLAFIFVIALIGMYTVQNAHSLMHVIGIIAIVAIAISAAIIARIKNLP